MDVFFKGKDMFEVKVFIYCLSLLFFYGSIIHNGTVIIFVLK